MTEATTTPPRYVSDTIDMLRVLDAIVYLRRCQGGRLVADGRQCPHCGSPFPGVECRAPKG